MRATGIVRRIDDLGRVVIPKEIRRTLRIREGDPLEIFTDSQGEVVLKKYSPIGELTPFAKEYSEALSESSGHITFITDRDAIIAVSGTSKKDYLEKSTHKNLEEIMENRRTKTIDPKDGDDSVQLTKDSQNDFSLFPMVIAPIIAEGDAVGTVIMIAKNEKTVMGEVEKKLTETAAAFLAKQMEQ